MTPTQSRPNWFMRIGPLNFFLVFIAVAIVLKLAHASPVVIFVASGIAIVPLAGLMGRATENLAETLGSGLGGLLNATFGNAAELIIALMALAKGEKFYPLVKASLTGSIIGNLLLVLGLAVFAGGVRFRVQRFNRTAASAGVAMLALAATGLIVPTLYHFVTLADSATKAAPQSTIISLSEEIAVVLIVVYLLSLLFSLRTHKHLFAGEDEKLPTTGSDHKPEWSRRTSVIVLAVATAGVALMSEFLTGSVESAGESMHLNHVFVGVIVVAIVGNAAEHSTAVVVAMKNKMDLAMNIALGSSIQIALFVAPVLVFASMAINPVPLDLHFTLLETLTIVLSVALVALVVQDGESHWMEGVLLLAVYLIFGLAFYHLPKN